MAQIVIIMGSKADITHSEAIKKELEKFNINVIMRIASAHKLPLKVLEIIKEYEKDTQAFITVAGKSNALSGLVDFHTVKPVIACPPYSEKFCGSDLFSSLSMPKGVAPMVVLEPEQAALAAAKIIAMSDENVRLKLSRYRIKLKEEIEKADQDLLNG
ncbi:MAG: AIR carboxylase family protein [Candidatus Hydrothermia bacterium]